MSTIAYSLTEARNWTFEDCARHVANSARALVAQGVGTDGSALVIALNDFRLENGSDGTPALFTRRVLDEACPEARALLRDTVREVQQWGR